MRPRCAASRAAILERAAHPAALTPRRAPRAPCRAAGGATAAADAAAAEAEAAAAVLDRFWQAQGVADADKRRALVAGGAADPADADAAGLARGGGAARVAALSRRLLALRALLGGRADVDVVWMVTREPGLLDADAGALAARLLALRTSAAAEGQDVAKVAEAQPGLLLQEVSESAPGDGADAAADVAATRRAWQHGLLGDGDAEWERRLAELEAYVVRAGDAHAGTRDGDDPELARWAELQRKAARHGALAQARAERLRRLGFELDGERAEWLRWHGALSAFAAANGHASPTPLAGGADLYLLNWCGVQRIARRSRRLAPDREALLTAIGFDWEGADPLS